MFEGDWEVSGRIYRRDVSIVVDRVMILYYPRVLWKQYQYVFPDTLVVSLFNCSLNHFPFSTDEG